MPSKKSLATAPSPEAAKWLEFFRDELNSDSGSKRAGILRKTKLVAAAVGPQDTRNELLPLLKEFNRATESDEVLHALGAELGGLVEFVGGDEHFPLLVHSLAELSTQEETVVRDQAIQSLRKIIEKVKLTSDRQKLVTEHIYPVYETLSRGDWFTAKVSACGLAPHIYPYLPLQKQNDLRRSVVALYKDDTPMVRRAATHNLQSLFLSMKKEDCIQNLAEFLETDETSGKKSWKDQQEEIRSSIVVATITLAKKLTPRENESTTYPVFKAAADDPSWKVRRTLTDKLDELVPLYGSESAATKLLTVFEQLLRDREPSVRQLAVEVLGRCVKHLSAEHLKRHIVPTFATLAADPSPSSVKAALATVLGPVSAQLAGRSETINELYKLFIQLTKDAAHDVRLNVVCHAGQICEVLNFDTVEKELLSTIESLITDEQWRIRLSVVNQIPRLAKQFGIDIYQRKLDAMLLTALTDQVYSVRECAAENVAVISDTFGSEWTISSLIPKVLDKYQPGSGPVDNKSSITTTNSYINRISVIHSLMPLSAHLSPEQVEKQLIPLLLHALEDSVANVRFAATRVLAQMLRERRIEKTAQDPIKSKLTGLLLDPDIDVKFFAFEALDAVAA
eukprot:Selendium_serpulae@DN5478_c0_g1_i1.p1